MSKRSPNIRPESTRQTFCAIVSPRRATRALGVSLTHGHHHASCHYRKLETEESEPLASAADVALFTAACRELGLALVASGAKIVVGSERATHPQQAVGGRSSSGVLLQISEARRLGGAEPSSGVRASRVIGRSSA